MRRISKWLCLSVVVAVCGLASNDQAQAAGKGQPTDWNRFNYYPYVYYPHNFQPQRGSFDHLYYRYGPEQRIPVFNKNWYNEYPSPKPYHKGHHFILDVF